MSISLVRFFLGWGDIILIVRYKIRWSAEFFRKICIVRYKIHWRADCFLEKSALQRIFHTALSEIGGWFVWRICLEHFEEQSNDDQIELISEMNVDEPPTYDWAMTYSLKVDPDEVVASSRWELTLRKLMTISWYKVYQFSTKNIRHMFMEKIIQIWVYQI